MSVEFANSDQSLQSAVQSAVPPAEASDREHALPAASPTSENILSIAAPTTPPATDDETAAAGGAAVAVIAPGQSGQVVAAIISQPSIPPAGPQPGAPSPVGDDGLPAPLASPSPSADAPESQSVIPLSVISAAEVAPRAYVPRPKPAIVPERCDAGWRTAGVLVERVAAGYYITVQQPPPRGPNRIYVTPSAIDKLIGLATGQVFDVGRLWKALCDIPLERPLPNRILEEELKQLLAAFANEIRR